MNERQRNKIEKRIILYKLQEAVTYLDEALFPDEKQIRQYRVHVKRLPYRDAVVVYRSKDNNLKVEVREKEGKHGRPHFHVKVKLQEVSIALDTYEILAGSIDNKYMKVVLAWAKDNNELLVGTWEKFHGSIVQVA